VEKLANILVLSEKCLLGESDGHGVGVIPIGTKKKVSPVEELEEKTGGITVHSGPHLGSQ